jgi:ABC-type Zn uptake system ZnuABC Zn-binding protein ZnuA
MRTDGALSAVAPTLLAATLLAATLLAACAPRPATSGDGRIGVVATTTILADLVAQVGGPDVHVTSLVPKGGEVHTYDPRPSDLVAVDDAALVVMNGLGLDDWLGRIAADVGADVPVVRLGEEWSSGVYIGGDDERPNPHLWLDVRLAAAYAGRIGAALAAADPAHADGYAARTDAYRERLGALDAWVRDRIATIPAERRSVVSFHDALPYYAAAYGLEIVGVVVPAPGQEPSAGEVASLVEAIRSSGVRAVFSEIQFDPSLAATLATEAGATVVADLYTDTLGDPPADSYEGVIRWDTERIVEALR